MTQPGESVYVVWAAGSEAHWHSCVCGVFEDPETAIRAAKAELSCVRDPGDTVRVDEFPLGAYGLMPREVWVSDLDKSDVEAE